MIARNLSSPDTEAMLFSGLGSPDSRDINLNLKQGDGFGNFEQGVSGMQFKIIQYEVKYSGENQWKEISEKACMEFLVDSFDPITPILADILNGKEIRTPYASYRLKG